MSYGDPSFPFAHIVFFSLADRSRVTRRRFIAACHEYLGKGHAGLTHFSVGARATEMQRDVSDLGFDVAMHMIFDSKASYEEYTQAPSHQAFITATAGMSTGRRVFDSYLIVHDEAGIPTEGMDAEESVAGARDDAEGGRTGEPSTRR
jgi:hypothetical protein